MKNAAIALPSPPRFFPLEKGIYEVAAGLRTFGTDFGNGILDQQVFPFDAEFARYRRNKLEARGERLSKYLQTDSLPPEVETRATRFILERLTTESPQLFTAQAVDQGGLELACQLTGERLSFDDRNRLIRATRVDGSESLLDPPYVSAFDALASQVQEDIAITVARDDRDWLAALHLCSPSHWAAEDKIGKNFFSVHTPVPGIEKINRVAPSFVDAMIHKGPYVRFVWGFGTDRRLNHHPEPAPGANPAEWKGRAFHRTTDGTSPFQLRVERQVTWGLPEVGAALFFIRVSFVDGEEIRRDPTNRALLRSSLLSMSPESLRYKGLAHDRDAVIEWLDEGK